MKKTLKIVLILTIVFSMTVTSFSSWGIHYSDATYNTCDEIQANLEEKIDNYFLPAAYDVSPFTVPYEDYFESSRFECAEFYNKDVVRDEKGKISIPPVYTLLVSNNLYYNYNPQFVIAYIIYNLNNRNNVEMTSSMWRVLHTNTKKYTGDIIETGVSIKSVLNAYIAPWTLYDGGKLYTWPEIMAMSEEELNSLDFSSYEFYTFISGVKGALEERGWWKEEYTERYNILYSHKENYIKSQPENEILTVAGERVYFSRINEEYNGGGTVSVNNIISVNIYDEEFANGIKTLDSDVKQKYSGLLSAIEKEYNTNRRDMDIAEGRKDYKEHIETCAPPQELACSLLLTMLTNYMDDTVEFKRYYGLAAFSVIERLNLSEEEIKKAFEEYNYVVGDYGAFNFDVIDTVVNNTKNENIDYFAYESSVVFDYEKNIVKPWWRVAASDWSSGSYDDELATIDDYDRVIARLEYLYNNIDSGSYKQNFKENIEYLKEYAGISTTPPATGENTVLYLAVACAAVVAMTAVALRRKREAVA